MFNKETILYKVFLNNERERNKRHTVWKEGIKTDLNHRWYDPGVKNSKAFTEFPLEIIDEFSNVTVCKINIHKINSIP